MAEVDFETRHKFADCCKDGDFDTAKKFIKDYPALINDTRPNSKTDFCPIHHGAAKGNLDFVKFCLTSGADPSPPSRTSAMLALQRKACRSQFAVCIYTRHRG
mmetsp:Transcript_167814/g.297195  ORF Transcript_167814/g.297195 Transcript_167814/m.297195 type:complete len:103 (+) Transcript_167814:104-412(+)